MGKTKGKGMQKMCIGILLFMIGVSTAKAQWEKQDSIHLHELLNSEEELRINPEAVNAIHFDFNANPDTIQRKLRISDDKPWMKFVNDFPVHHKDTAKQAHRAFMRLDMYTPYMRWDENPFMQLLTEWEKDSLKHYRTSWKLIHIAPDPSRLNGHIPVPPGMDPTVTPSASPVVGGLDFNQFFYDLFSERGRLLRYNSRHANAWKTYKDYIPTRQDSVKKDSVILLEWLRQQAEEIYPSHEPNPRPAPADTLRHLSPPPDR